jgi:hypothetical protein
MNFVITYVAGRALIWRFNAPKTDLHRAAESRDYCCKNHHLPPISRINQRQVSFCAWPLGFSQTITGMSEGGFSCTGFFGTHSSGRKFMKLRTALNTSFAATAALALAACGSADDASVEAEAETVETAADEAMEGEEAEVATEEGAMAEEGGEAAAAEGEAMADDTAAIEEAGDDAAAAAGDVADAMADEGSDAGSSMMDAAKDKAEGMAGDAMDSAMEKAEGAARDAIGG